MFLTRDIGGFLRGRNGPVQLYAACLLGAWLGFAPGFGTAPGWTALLVALLLLLNVNLFLVGLVSFGAKLLYWLLLPVWFELGVGLLEGPTQGLFSALIALPIVAWFGLEHYVVSAGIVVGAVLGLGLGWAVTRALKTFRRRMASAETQSAAYQRWSARWYVKAVGWIFFGGVRGADKAGWQGLSTRTHFRPIRYSGLALLLVLVGIGALVLNVFDGVLIRTVLQGQLQQTTGATVDVGEVDFDPEQNRLVVEDLALADPQDLSKNLFEARLLTADVATSDLLAKRFVISRMEVQDGLSGTARETPGEHIGPRPKLPDPPPDPDAPFDWEAAVRNAQVWRERLEQVGRILEKIAPQEPSEDEEVAEDVAEKRVGWREALRQRAEALGYEPLASESVVQQTPTLVIESAVAGGIRLEQLPGEVLDIEASHLSSHPGLLDQAPQLKLSSRSGKLDLLALGLGVIQGASEPNTLAFSLRGISMEALETALSEAEQLPFEGGTFDIETQGTFAGVTVDLPLNITLQDTVLSWFGQRSEVDTLQLPIALEGSLRSPRLRIPPETLQQALSSAAQGKVQQLVQNELGDRLPSALQGFLGGGQRERDEEPADAEPSTETEQNTEPEAQERARSLFDNLRRGLGNSADEPGDAAPQP